MGRGRKPRSAVNLIADVSSDDDSLSSSSSAQSEPPLPNATERVNSLEDDLENCLDALYEKRGQTREKALASFIVAFENHMLHSFVESRSFTLLHQFSNCIKRGSSKEICLASRAIGLLALTIGGNDNAHEMVEETVPHLSQALKSGTDTQKKISVADCLAVITFIAGADEDTEKSMRIIWELINPKSGPNVIPTKPTPALLSSAVSAWAFLLTTMTPRRMNSINWQESVTMLSNLLDKEDRSVRIAAGEALALIFEMNALSSISKRAENDLDTSPPVDSKCLSGISYVETLKGKILTQSRNLSSEAGGKGSVKTDLGIQRELFQRILDFIETKDFNEVSVKVLNNCNPLKLSSWTQSIQLNFLRRFLGGGYLRHMQDNDLLHDIFTYVPKKRESLSVAEKRMYYSPNSAVSKERTQYLNRQRAKAQNRNEGHFAVGNEEDY